MTATQATATPGLITLQSLVPARLAGAVLLLAVSAPMPAYSLFSGVAFSTKVLLGILVALYPVWLIARSCRPPGHLADNAGFALGPSEVV